MAFKMKKFSGFSTPMKKNIDPPKPMVNKPRAKKDGESDAAYQAYLNKWKENAKRKDYQNVAKNKPATPGTGTFSPRQF
tara:strand:+ start:352 stop:588 length:237 start_codon:yes stop_codon:yes gene_type:complete